MVVNYNIENVIGAPVGLPPFIPHLQLINPTPVNASPVVPPPEIPGTGLPRAITYLADYGGCSFYRCMAPNLLLNLYQKAVIIESTTMIVEPNFYSVASAVKLQRQATPHQKDFITFLRQLSNKHKLKLIYEIDDVVFAEDIPLYNRNRDAFVPAEIQKSIYEIFKMMDEITVTSDYFRDYIKAKTNHPNVTTIPNYLLRWWFDGYYNLGELIKRFEKNKKRPIVAIFASGTHVDVLNRVNQKDDFASVVDVIIKTRKMFRWKFYGSHPLPLRPYIQNGEIEFVPWVPLVEFARAMYDSHAQVTFAALQDNEFNRCKSSIKLLEAGALGLPCICPNMVTYKDATLKYNTADEFIDLIKKVTKDQTVYAKHCKQARAFAENYWLDTPENLMKHYEVFFVEPSKRQYIKSVN